MAKATFHWEDPFLLDHELTDEERMVAESIIILLERF